MCVDDVRQSTLWTRHTASGASLALADLPAAVGQTVTGVDLAA